MVKVKSGPNTVSKFTINQQCKTDHKQFVLKTGHHISKKQNILIIFTNSRDYGFADSAIQPCSEFGGFGTRL